MDKNGRAKIAKMDVKAKMAKMTKMAKSTKMAATTVKTDVNG